MTLSGYLELRILLLSPFIRLLTKFLLALPLLNMHPKPKPEKQAKKSST